VLSFVSRANPDVRPVQGLQGPAFGDLEASTAWFRGARTEEDVNMPWR